MLITTLAAIDVAMMMSMGCIEAAAAAGAGV
jgi:hypothetical protein